MSSTGRECATSMWHRPFEIKVEPTEPANSCLTDKGQPTTQKFTQQLLHSKPFAELNLNRTCKQAGNEPTQVKRVRFVDRPVFIPNTKSDAAQGIIINFIINR